MASSAEPVHGSGHVVYVNISTGQPHTAQKRRRRAALLAGCVVGAMCACLAIGGFMEERSYGAYMPATVELTEHVVNHQDISALESQMAAQEVKESLLKKASSGLPAQAAKMAESLATETRTTTLDDCSQKAALDLIKSNFEALMTKLQSENATLTKTNSDLATAAASAKSAWMESESTYRMAETKVNTATQAQAYASSQYSKYSTAVTEGQESYDKLKPKYDQEKAQLQRELPVLLELKGLIATLIGTPAPAAADAPGKPSVLSQVSGLVASLVPPSTDATVATKVDRLKQQLADTKTGGVSSSAHAVVDKLVSEMSLRIAELDRMLHELDGELATNKASLSTAEKNLVALGEELDSAKNQRNTADLQRKTLGGQYAVAKQSYEDNNATFLDDAAKLSREIGAIGTILDKVDAAIATCAGKST